MHTPGHAGRDQKAMQAATEIKDAMRERCLPALVHACYQLAVQLQGGSPGLAAGLLQAISRFINWIDISLVANEQCALSRPLLLRGCLPGFCVRRMQIGTVFCSCLSS